MKLRYVILPFVLLYAAYASFMYAKQAAILFPAASKQHHAMRPALPAGAEVVEIPVSFGHARAVYWPPHDRTRPAPAIWYAHGNYETVEDSFAMVQPLVARNIAVLQYEYPGYDGSDGTPTFESIRETGEATWEWLSLRAEVDATRMIAMGYSIGGGPATELGVRHNARALVLLSTYVSIAEAARHYALPSMLVAFPYDNAARIREFAGPVFIGHGRRDNVIPFSSGKSLAATAAQRGEFLALDCGHADCDFARSVFAERLPSALAHWGILAAATR